MRIVVKNWAKYNPKRAQTKYSWLRLNNDFYLSQDLFELDPAEKYVWVILLCVVSKENTGEAEISIPHLSHFARIDKNVIEGAIQKLKKIELIDIIGECSITTPSCSADEFATPTRRDETRRNETILSSELDDAVRICVEHLNAKTGKEFKFTTKATRTKIKSLIRSKNTIEDIKRVIDFKVNEWGHDCKMRQYLRPETLFSSKFEGYLEAAKETPQSDPLKAFFEEQDAIHGVTDE